MKAPFLFALLAVPLLRLAAERQGTQPAVVRQAAVPAAALCETPEAPAKPADVPGAGTTLLTVPAAQFPRLFTDERGNPVLSWIEQTPTAVTLVYRRSAAGGQPFGPPARIDLPAPTAAHGEDVPRLIFKGDGTRMVVFSLPRPQPEALRAGDLLYKLSTDGKSWTQARPVHRDTTAGRSHSYADLTRLPDGEIGLIWLDDKLPGREGRSVRFTRTRPEGGFGPEVIVDSSACPCCRPAIASDSRGQLFLTYRDLLPTGDRDISYVVSTDGGQTFGAPATPVRDRWQINACPHTGPQLYVRGESVYAAWYSGAAGREGIRLTRLDTAASPERLPGANRTHPQVSGWPDGRMALVWEEMTGEAPEGYRQIRLRLTTAGGSSQTVLVSAPGERTSLPVLLPTGAGLLVAYQVWQGPETHIVLRQLPFFQP